MEAYPRLFARFKILLDPMFPRLAGFSRSPRHIIDIGCGYGVPSVWLLSLFPQARVYGIDPDRRRVVIAARAFAGRGFAETGSAPGLPVSAPDRVDTALMVDVMHFISDDEARMTLQCLREKLAPEGRLILRVTVPSGRRPSWLRRVEMWRLGTVKRAPRYRTAEEVRALLSGAGFSIERAEPDAAGREEVWFVGRA
jgi:SAM-dependent methyltransferase